MYTLQVQRRGLMMTLSNGTKWCQITVWFWYAFRYGQYSYALRIECVNQSNDSCIQILRLTSRLDVKCEGVAAEILLYVALIFVITALFCVKLNCRRICIPPPPPRPFPPHTYTPHVRKTGCCETTFCLSSFLDFEAFDTIDMGRLYTKACFTPPSLAAK